MLIKMLSLVACSVILILKVVISDADNGFVTVSVNSHSLNFTTTNRSVSYVGEANYNYEDGEDLYVSCGKVHNIFSTVTLRLEYYNAEGTLLFKTLPGGTTQSHIYFRSLLKSINDKYYLDCIRATTDPEGEYRYRTTFYVKKRDLNNAVQHAMILSVNGQKLTVNRNNGKPSDEHYLFRYIDGDILNVTCRKTDVNMRGSLEFFYDDTIRHVGPVVKSPSEGSISINTSASNINRKILTCSINNSDVQNPNASISFVSDISESDVRIRGLPTNNILYQYTKGLNRWTIEYQYTMNETLNLSCVGKGSPLVSMKKQRFQWEFNGESSASAALSLPTTLVVAEKIFSKILNSNHTGKIIRCVYMANLYPNKTVEIILRLKSKAVIRKSEGGENISGLENKTLSIDNDSKASYSFIVPGSSIAAVLVVLAVTSVALYCVRTKNARRLMKNQKPMTSNEDPVYHNNSVYEIPNENDNQNDVYRHEVVANNDTFNENRENVQNIDPEDHDYAEILDFHCRPGTQIRKIPVHNELYAHGLLSVQTPQSYAN